MSAFLAEIRAKILPDPLQYLIPLSAAARADSFAACLFAAESGVKNKDGVLASEAATSSIAAASASLQATPK